MHKQELLSIAGFPRKLYYGEEDSSVILMKHREIADEYRVENPYFDFTDTNRRMRIACDLPDKVFVRVGEIGAYPVWQVAVWINEQVNRYVRAGTMGRTFSGEDEQENRKLTSAMIRGYDESRIIVTFDKEQEEKWTPVAGVQAYRGKGERTLWESIKTGETESIGTLSALQIDTINPAIAFLNLRERYGEVPEKNIVGMSRLWRAENEKLTETGVLVKDLSWMAMAFLILGVAKPVLHDSRGEAPEIFIYDTSTTIQAELKRIFDMREVVDKSHLKPTEQVLSTILSHHYKEWEGDLIIGEIAFGKYLVNAWTYLSKRGIDVPKIMEVA